MRKCPNCGTEAEHELIEKIPYRLIPGTPVLDSFRENHYRCVNCHDDFLVRVVKEVFGDGEKEFQ